MSETAPPEVVSAELAVPEELLDVTTGEVLPATISNARRVLAAARVLKARIREEEARATAFVIEESRRLGTKTFRVGAESVVLSGGSAIEYDAHDLAEALRAAGCPEERIYNGDENEVEGVVAIEQTFKVRLNVLRQLVAANEDYAAAAAKAKREVSKPWRASVK